MKYEFFCSDCGIEAIIEITDDPFNNEPEETVTACFCCGSDGVVAKIIDDEDE